jgi:hypothetical protein
MGIKRTFASNAVNIYFMLVTNNLCGMIGMTNIEDRPPPAVGAYWINEEDYPELLKIFVDGNKMPRTWNEGLKIAEEMERGLNAYGSRELWIGSCLPGPGGSRFA